MTRPLAENRMARRKYTILERFEAGIALVGTEVKAARAGRVQLRDSFARIMNEEAFLLNCHIAHYEHAGIKAQHEPTRTRKLLLRKAEIRRLGKKVAEKGLTLVPLKIYLKRGNLKVEIGLARGKEERDRREELKKRDAEREIRRALAGRSL